MRCILYIPYFKKTSRQYEKTYKYTSELLAYYIKSDKENLTMKSLILAQDER